MTPIASTRRYGPSMPPLARGAMLARPWTGFWRGLGAALGGGGSGAAALAPAPWQDAARRRR
ncbi:MAG: hypothetical protein KGI36_21825, partial [Burkholderiales bacterium]|nr:hypothetical protein [Burkholderiales bacterium]